MNRITVLLIILLSMCALFGSALTGEASSYRVTFIEFGSDMCVSCRGMKAVTEEIARKYESTVKAVYSDVMVSDSLATVYKVEQIPTQVYFGTDGKEFLRHEDMATVEDISRIIDDYLSKSDKK
jgi:thioredoxin 1